MKHRTRSCLVNGSTAFLLCVGAYETLRSGVAPWSLAAWLFALALFLLACAHVARVLDVDGSGEE